jgi:hypothetical protein
MAKIIKTLKTTLKGSLSATGLSFKVQEFVDSKNNTVAYSDFGGNFVVVFEQGTQIEMILCTGITQNADDTATLTIHASGRHLDPKSPYTGGATGLSFTTGASVIVTNDPYTLSKFAHTENDNAFTGDNSFTNFPTKVGTGIATANDEFMTYGHALSLLTGSANIDQLLVSGVAGENLTDGDAVYFKESDQKWWKASASATATSQGVKLGVSQAIALAGASVNIFLGGLEKNQTGMTAGDKMYLGDTAGTIVSTAGTNEVFVGWAKSATELLWGHNEDIETITAKEKDALQAPSGLDLSTDNRILDEGSASNGAEYTASTIAFVDSNPDTITDSANGFVTAGFRRGQEITISGSTSNDGTYRIKSVVAGTITLVTNETLTVEALGASVTMSAVTADKIAQFDPNGELPLELAQTLTAFEGLTAGDLVKHINDSGASKYEKLAGEYPDYSQSSTFNAQSSSIGSNPDADNVRAKALSSTLVVVAYDDAGASNYPYVHALSIATDGTITVGAKTTVNSANSNGIIALSKLTATTFVIGYYSGGTVYYKHGSISGTTITLGSSTATTGNDGAVATEGDATTFAVGHTNSGSKFVTQIGTVSGTTITFGAETEVDATGTGTSNRDVDLTMLTTSLLVASWKETSTAYCAVATVSGTTIGTFGATVSESVISSNGVTTVERLTDTKFVWGYSNGSWYVKARVCTVSGTTVTKGAENAIYSSGNNNYLSIAIVNKLSFAIAYYSSGVGRMNIVNIQSDGETMSVGTVQEFDASGTGGGVTINTLSTTRFIVSWDDTANPVYAKTIDCTALDDREDLVGISEATIDADTTGKICVVRGDKAKNQTLTAGAKYYAQSDGTLGTTETNYLVGNALSTTELLFLI